MKEINNIVFYNYFEGNKEKRNACVFYSDGSVETLSYEDGISACEEVAKQRNITSKDAFKVMINSAIVHVMTGDEFKEKFSTFVAKEVVKEETVEEAEEEQEVEIEDEEQEIEIEDEELVEEDKELTPEELAALDYDDEFDEDFDDSFDYDDIEDEFEEPVKKESKIKGFFKKQVNKFKNASEGFRAGIIGLAVIVGLSGTGMALKHKSKVGKIYSSNFASVDAANEDKRTTEEIIAAITETTTEGAKEEAKTDLVNNNNDYYDNYTTDQLLEVTNNKTQKTAMKNLIKSIKGFNGPFASAYVESDKDVKAALSFDEIEALQQAYNEYTKEDIKAIFNGAEVRAEEMTKDYKAASLQLMGAYVLETSENPVNMMDLVEAAEGKDFYNRYHQMFLAAKEAKGQDQLDKVKEFYDAIKTDFPITQEVRTEGIAHSQSYDSIKAYKLSVTPMIAAAEIIFQNLDVDYTLNDNEIDFINDIGLCNYADDTFERVETVLLAAEEDNTNPLYTQYREAVITELTNNNQYVIDDEHRELSYLTRFQEIVNAHFDEYEDSAEYTGSSSTKVTKSTKTKKKTWKTTTTTAKKDRTIEEKEIPTKEKKKIDKKIDKENADAKKKAEKEAEATRKRIQAEEDENAKKINKEIEEEEKDMNKKVDEANDKINNGQTVNEKDFEDHNVKFNEDKKDQNGNLDKSVKDITTDPTGDETNKDLPDPNETGRIFDEKMDTKNSPISERVQYRIEDDTTSKNVEYVSEDAYIEYPEGYVSYDENGLPINEYESAVNKYVESLADSDTEENSYQYTK